MDYHVSPAGSDDNPGSAQRPFLTLERARDALRGGPASHDSQNVYLAGGTYHLRSPVVFGPEDGNTCYAAATGQRPVLSGLAPLADWLPMDDTGLAVAPQARGKLFVAEITPGLRPGGLLVHGQPCPRAAFPATDDWATWPLAQKIAENRLKLPPELCLAHTNLADIELNILPTPWTKWRNNLFRVVAMDDDVACLDGGLSVNKLVPATDESPARIENCLEALSTPGQWCADSRAGRLYYWPPEGGSPTHAAIPVAQSLVRVVGGDEPVRGLSFRGLGFVGTAGPDAAALAADGAHELVVEDCEFAGIAGQAVYIGGASRHCAVRDCRVDHCGDAGVVIAGAACPVLRVENEGHTVERCEISRVGERAWNAPAIAIRSASHNTIRHNYIHDTPYAGITNGGARMIFVLTETTSAAGTTLGREDIPGIETMNIVDYKRYVSGYNMIQGNILRGTMQQLDDGGAIYSHASHHNIVRGNVTLDTPRNHAYTLYFDDDETDSLMEHNLVLEHARLGPHGTSIHIHDNARNTVRRNVVLGTRRPFSFGASYGGHQVCGNVFVLRAAPDPHDPNLAPALPAHGKGRYKEIDWDAGPNVFDGNLYWSDDDGATARQMLATHQALGVDEHSQVLEPGIVASLFEGSAMMTVATDSPAQRLGVIPIDLAGNPWRDVLEANSAE
jgi:hypothetical protein